MGEFEDNIKKAFKELADKKTRPRRKAGPKDPKLQIISGSGNIQAGRDVKITTSKLDHKIQPPTGTIGGNPLLRQRIEGLLNDIGMAREKRFGKAAYAQLYSTLKKELGIPRNQKWTMIWLLPENLALGIIEVLEAKMANTITGRIRGAAKKPGHMPSRPQLYARENELLEHLGMTMRNPELRALMKEYFGVSSHSDLSIIQHQQLVEFLRQQVEAIENS